VVEEGFTSRAHGAEEGDAGAVEPAGDEAQHGGAGPVEPRQVVDDQEQRGGLGHVTQEHERRVRYDEPFRRCSAPEAQSDLQRFGVRRLEFPERLVDGEEDLVQPGIAHVGLELDTGGTQDPRAVRDRRFRHGIEQ
jgi:hypothetical protein